jgi:hypothetical protein
MGYYRPGLVEVQHNRSMTQWLRAAARPSTSERPTWDTVDTSVVDEGYLAHFADTLRFYLDRPAVRRDIAATGARLFRARRMQDTLERVIREGC